MTRRIVPVIWLTAAIILLSAFIHQQILFFRNSEKERFKQPPDSIPPGRDFPDDTLLILDFETPLPGYETHQTMRFARSGNGALTIGPGLQYSPGLHTPILQVDSVFPFWIQVSAWFRYEDPVAMNHVSLVTTGNHHGKAFRYRFTPLSKQPRQPGKWLHLSTSWLVPEPLDSSDLLQVYIWNPGNRVCFIDDLHITLFRSKP